MEQKVTKKNRRQTRNYIVQALFAYEFYPEDEQLSFPEEEAKGLIDFAYADAAIRGVKDKKVELDAMIQKYSPKRKVEHLDRIDRTIMRVALWEMNFAEEPVAAKVAINEAVQLAKAFGSDSSYKLVNAILDAYAKGK
ncbi:MAG: transcription antitermination factor NusB [Veillonella sp.]|mgnify:FL=1|nr:transcription antitermination factor NusB [Veillonella sp.]